MTKNEEIFSTIWIPCEAAMFIGLIMALWGNGWWFLIALPALLVAIISAAILTWIEKEGATE